MADKKISIDGKLSLDVGSATKALDDVAKKFKQFEKGGSSKMFEDFRKIKPLIKELDSGLAKMMGQLSKEDSTRRIRELNSGLKQQAEYVRTLVEEQKNLNREMAAAKNQEQRSKIQDKLELSQNTARAAMGRMSEDAKERNELKGNSGGSSYGYLKAGAAIAGAGQVIGGAIDYMGKRDLSGMQYSAQAQSMGNKMFNAGLMTNSLQMGMALSSRGTNPDGSPKESYMQQGVKAAREAQMGELEGGGAKALGNIGGATLAGAQLGPAGAAGGFIASTFGEGVKAAPYLDPKTQDAAFRALGADQQGKAWEAIQTMTQPQTELADLAVARAPMKLAAEEAMAGGGGSGSGRALQAAMNRNFSLARPYGVSMSEAAGMMSSLGQSGAIGEERRGGTDGQAFKDMLMAKGSGIANPGEFAGLIGGMASSSGDAKHAEQQTMNAIKQGVKMGVDVSLVKNLVRATEEIASIGGTSMNDTSAITSLLSTALSGNGKKTSDDIANIGQADIKGAQDALGMRQNFTSTPMGAAIQGQVMQKHMENLGIDSSKLSEAAKLAIGQLDSSAKIDQSPTLKTALMNAVGGDKKKYEAFMKDFDNMKEEGTLRSQTGWSKEAGIFANNLQGTRDDLNGKNGTAAKAKAEAQVQRYKEELRAVSFSEKATEGAEGLLRGNPLVGKSDKEVAAILKGGSAGTGPRGLASYAAGQEGKQEAAIGKIAEEIKASIALQSKASEAIVQTFNGKDKDGNKTLGVSMDNLETAINRNTDALLGRKGGATQAEQEAAAKKSERAKQRAEDDAQADAVGGVTGYLTKKVMHGYRAMTASASDTINNAVPASTSSAVDKIKIGSIKGKAGN